ncbi:MAG: tetratricopeptide repeat protein [bacterium]|nr:tetratricopeptide repeat protein [bacterium]
MNTLIIQHIPNSSPPKFLLQEPEYSDYSKNTQLSALPSPYEFPVIGVPNTDLMQGIRWYLEDFLNYPFEPDTDKAKYILAALEEWGTKVFDTLFNPPEAVNIYRKATQKDVKNLHLLISSDNPFILSWPWEGLHDKNIGTLAHFCQFGRKLNKIKNSFNISNDLPQNQINILMVTARPYKNDVPYCSMSRPLVELIKENQLSVPVKVTILRPPTFKQLREHLSLKPNHYHIVHFDGHGGYGYFSKSKNSSDSSKEGIIVFENDKGAEDQIKADKLSQLLKEYAIPAVILNACQSAMLDEYAQDPFATVAASLLKAGIHSVTAMAYVLYASAAKVFLSEFYSQLLKTGSMTHAIRAGKQQMFSNNKRICVRGEYPLQDWLVPVLYQQESVNFSFAQKGIGFIQDKETLESEKTESFLHQLPDEDNPYGFIGRNRAILELERAIRQDKPAILIYGMGGVGKTTLAYAFLQWLNDTQGLENEPFLFSFKEQQKASDIFNHMVERFKPVNIEPSIDKKIDYLAGEFNKYSHLIIWDNFEVVKGIQGTAIKPVLSEEDCSYLSKFLEKIYNGKSKVIITSRSPERWLGEKLCSQIPLGGLMGEERWEFCEVILNELGLQIDRDDINLIRLMDILNGQPLLMRVILPTLENRSAESVISVINEQLSIHDSKDEVHSHLYAILRFVEDELPEDFKPLLAPLAFSEEFVDISIFKNICKHVNLQWNKNKIFSFFQILCHAGLLNEYSTENDIYRIHPALTGFLRNVVLTKISTNIHDEWIRAFVNVFGELAEISSFNMPHDQEPIFYFHRANFNYALTIAKRQNMVMHIAALIRFLAKLAETNRNFKKSKDLFIELAEIMKKTNNQEGEAEAYYHLGIIGQEQMQLTDAKKWFKKSQGIYEKSGDQAKISIINHQLGRIALHKGNYCDAEKMNVISRELSKKYNNERGEATSYFQSGRNAEEQKEFMEARKYYKKALKIFNKLEDFQGEALIYHQYGMINEAENNISEALKWYKKSLDINEKHEYDLHSAKTYHHLGRIAEKENNLDKAEKYYMKSLQIEERFENDQGAASSYFHLGTIAHRRGDIARAKKWYLRAREIDLKIEDKKDAASTCYHLGMIMEAEDNFIKAKEFYLEALKYDKMYNNEQEQKFTYIQLAFMALDQNDFVEAEKWYRNVLAINEKYDSQHEVAISYASLGNIILQQERFEESAQWTIKALLIFSKLNDRDSIPKATSQFMTIFQKSSPSIRKKLKSLFKKELGYFPEI